MIPETLFSTFYIVADVVSVVRNDNPNIVTSRYANLLCVSLANIVTVVTVELTRGKR